MKDVESIHKHDNVWNKISAGRERECMEREQDRGRERVGQNIRREVTRKGNQREKHSEREKE